MILRCHYVTFEKCQVIFHEVNQHTMGSDSILSRSFFFQLLYFVNDTIFVALETLNFRFEIRFREDLEPIVSSS